MYLTEPEAREKACCKAFPHREGGQLFTAACLGSACMAWRWEMAVFILSKNRFAKDKDSYRNGDYEYRPTERGYCGLVGGQE